MCRMGNLFSRGNKVPAGKGVASWVMNLIRCQKCLHLAPDFFFPTNWCKKECFSAPKVIPGRKWCTNGAFSTLEVVPLPIQCKKECFSAPKVIPRRKWCTNGAFSAPGVICREEWCTDGAFPAPEPVPVGIYHLEVLNPAGTGNNSLSNLSSIPNIRLICLIDALYLYFNSLASFIFSLTPNNLGDFIL